MWPVWPRNGGPVSQQLTVNTLSVSYAPDACGVEVRLGQTMD